MKKLLSLPPNLVGSFHEIANADPADWFCTSDPIGARLGSGGGTTWLLEACRRDDDTAGTLSTGEWLAREKRIFENSDFNTGVVRQCFLQSEEAGYQLKVTFFNENSTVATVSQVSQIPYGMDGVNMAKVEMQFPFQVDRKSVV